MTQNVLTHQNFHLVPAPPQAPSGIGRTGKRSAPERTLQPPLRTAGGDRTNDGAQIPSTIKLQQLQQSK